MATSELMIKDPLKDQAAKTNQVRLEQIEGVLSKTKKSLIQKNIEIVMSQKQKMSKFTQRLKNIKQKIQLNETQCTKGINDIKSEISDLEKKISIYELENKTKNKEKQYQEQIDKLQKEYLKAWEKRISIANTVDIKPFNDVQIQNKKSKAHEVFKWIVLAIYGQPENKYYWPNFQEQVFQKDKGQDFKVRLGKVNASTAKQEQIVKTLDFLKNFKDCQSCPEVKNVYGQIQKIRQVAQIYKQCYDISRKTKQLEKSIQKSKQESIEKDQQSMKWRARVDALKDRMVINEKYAKVLKTMSTKVQNKNSEYLSKQAKLLQFLQKTKQFDGIGQLVTNVSQEQNGNCQCSIF